MEQRKQVMKVALLIFSIIDCCFGIVSLFLEPMVWQVLSLTSSVATFIFLTVMVLTFRAEAKSNITTAVLGVADILSGVLTIVLALGALKVVVIAISFLKTFKAGKVVIQGEKALQLAKAAMPIVKKAVPVVVAVIGKQIKNYHRGVNMSNEKKKNVFVEFLKNNWQTILGILAGIYCVIENRMDFIGGALQDLGINHNYAQAIIAPLYVLAANGMLKGGIELGKAKPIRELAKKLGLEKVYDTLVVMQEEKLAEDAKIAEENAKAQALLDEIKRVEDAEAEAKAKAEADRIAMEEQAKKEQEERVRKIEAEQIRINYNNAVANGSFVGTIEEYIKQSLVK